MPPSRSGQSRLDHVGIAVRRIMERLPLYAATLGVEPGPVEEVPGEKVRVVFLSLGETRLELLEPSSPDSPLARFLDRRGEGIHHLCFQVGDLEAVLKQLRGEGVRLVDPSPRAGAGGSKVAFVHPRGTGGVLIELKEEPTR
ncbi:MAG: methylmalonyl-CoA epimerase [Acidobacteriota bacterium]